LANSDSQGIETGPVGQGEYSVQQGDCIDSIATARGLRWKTLWNHPANAQLKRIRKDPNLLLPGDRVTIPESSEKYEKRSTEKRHTFVRLGVPAKLKFRLLTADGKPRKGLPYILKVEAETFKGKTDPDGNVTLSISPLAKDAQLTILDAEGNEIENHSLSLGGLDPITEISGVQGRLRGLGFDCGEVDGVLTPETQDALRRFQEACGIPVTGELDSKTQQELASLHGS
jgi:hypothetical protein